MKKASTLFLKLALLVIGLIALAICIFAVPSISKGVVAEFPVVARLYYIILFGLWATAIPFYFALYQSYLLLNYIDKNQAFSELAVKALKRIKQSAIAFGILYVAFMPIVFMIADSDDAPGLILYFSAIFIGIPTTIAVFTAVLGKLLRNAIDIKRENDLTV